MADVGVSSEAKRVVRLAVERFGRLDYLINNAAISDFRFLDEMEESFLDEMIRVNLKAPILMMQAALPQMKRQRFGRIVNASSISGHYADVAQGPYRITVNAYAPGIIETDMTREMIADRGGVQLRQIPAGRFGAVEDAAALVLLLCGESAGYITGEIIGVDGGMLRAQYPFRPIERTQHTTDGYFIHRGLLDRDTVMQIKGAILDRVLQPTVGETIRADADPMDPMNADDAAARVARFRKLGAVGDGSQRYERALSAERFVTLEDELHLGFLGQGFHLAV